MIQVVVGDVAAVKADAVVRAATTRLEPADDVSRRLDAAGGAGLAEQRSLQQSLEVGTAVVTTAGTLRVDLVIHAVLESETEPITLPVLQRALRSTLQRVEQWEIEHVALPPLGTGAGQLPFDDAARALIDELRQHGRPFPSTISVVVETDEQRGLVEALLGAGAR